MREAVGAIIVAAGRSERMGGGDKVLAAIAGRPLIAHTIAAIAAAVDELVLVAADRNRTALEAIAATIAPSARVVGGGARRRDSVAAGLAALPACEYVIVHDGARPLVTAALVEAALVAARAFGAATCAVPVGDTVKRGDAEGFVRGTVSREGLWLVQTPQAFRRDLLVRAHAAVEGDTTDDAVLVEQLEAPVRLVPGSARNLKITTQADLALAEALLASSPAPPAGTNAPEQGGPPA